MDEKEPSENKESIIEMSARIIKHDMIKEKVNTCLSYFTIIVLVF